MDQDEFLVKERGTLEAYFSCLGHFNFDKAKEIVEKERDALLKSSAYYLFSGVLTSLSQLAVAEKLYMSLQYLVPKSFLRKDFTLYFNRILSKQTTHQEMKHLGSKMSIDYCQRIAAFQKKSDALCVVVLFDALGVESYYERGYRHPHHAVEAPKGVDNYPAIYYYPTTYQEKQHRPNVIMIINKSTTELSAEGVVCFYDKHVGTTYFLTKLDQRITLVAIYGSHKSDRETFVLSFVQELAQQVRGNRVFSALKPGSK